MPDGFHADTSDFNRVARDLRRAAERIRPEVDRELRALGATMETTAKQIAGEHSKSIPPSIHMRPLPGAVELTAGGEDAPLAALYELGNRGGRRDSKTFRHPVYGTDVWVEQARYRFFAPARRLLKPAARLGDAWERALRSVGIHTSE